MQETPAGFHEQYDALVEELLAMGPFRRGTITERYRKCGNPTCACAGQGHRGHGPQTILTYKEQGVTRTVNLPTGAAVARVRAQIEEHEHFQDWAKRWRILQEEISEVHMTQAQTPATDDALKKKLRRASRTKSRGKSKR